MCWLWGLQVLVLGWGWGLRVLRPLQGRGLLLGGGLLLELLLELLLLRPCPPWWTHWPLQQ